MSLSLRGISNAARGVSTSLTFYFFLPLAFWAAAAAASAAFLASAVGSMSVARPSQGHIAQQEGSAHTSSLLLAHALRGDLLGPSQLRAAHAMRLFLYVGKENNVSIFLDLDGMVVTQAKRTC
jgi:hypothetical protein